MGLQVADMLAHGRLGHVQLLCCVRQVQVPGRGFKGAQGVQGADAWDVEDPTRQWAQASVTSFSNGFPAIITVGRVRIEVIRIGIFFERWITMIKEDSFPWFGMDRHRSLKWMRRRPQCCGGKPERHWSHAMAQIEQDAQGPPGWWQCWTGSGLALGWRQDERFAMCSTFKPLGGLGAGTGRPVVSAF